MTRIKIEVPSNDETALFCMGKSLVDMSGALSGIKLVIIKEDEYELLTRLHAATETLQQAAPQMMDELRFEGEELQGKRKDTTAQQVESLGATHIITEQKLAGDPIPLGDGNFSQGYIATVEEIADPVDSTGTPWDERIHSASKALNADGTWRLRRKPKDMDETEWAAFVETVKLELNHGEKIREAMDKAERGEAVYYTSEEAEQKMGEFKESVRQRGEVNKGVTVISQEGVEVVTEALGGDDVEPPVTPPGDDFHTDADVVTEQTVAGIPPLPVPPPVVVAPPVPVQAALSEGTARYGDAMSELAKNDGDVQWDFPRLMTFLTERHGKIDVATVNTLLAQDGMSSVQELNAHPDKIGPFVARVKAHLGE